MEGRFFAPGCGGPGEPLIVTSFADTDVALVREAAVAAVRAIGAQREGFDPAPEGTESHFERFFDIYKRVSVLSPAERRSRGRWRRIPHDLGADSSATAPIAACC